MVGVYMFDAKEKEVIDKISSIEKKKLESFFSKIDEVYPEWRLSNLAKGYVMYRLNRVAEAAKFLCEVDMGQEDFGHILKTGYRKGIDGDWHSYDDNYCGNGNKSDNNDDCCSDHPFLSCAGSGTCSLVTILV